ncbi:Uncharacterized membrane protein YhaH, DUF805 family [Duganella sp. CF458]|uniref:DUF805 domain-containing protein n=1 Tax=Duganella sp. CF458 TaxID=1884368 RepID=UPI0008F1D4E2|nr:DUF805 domain-containing protein [Duganella sp. CF458]SFG21785.1 Uncharacterized membrane protein YhaH, DUF805 family [Duganella sp. CF458]
MSNPYSMPQSELTERVSDETYMPKFFSLSGRIGRVRYWAFSMGAGLLMIPIMILTMGLGALTGAVAGAGVEGGASGGVLGAVVAYGLSFAITLVLARRRLNDLGKSGWLGLLMLVPLVNIFMALWLLFGPGDAQANEYGPPPASNSTFLKVVAWVVPVLFFGILFATAIPAYQAYTEKARAAQMGE